MTPAVGAAGVGDGEQTRGWKSTITAPPWGETIPERIAWCCWFLAENPIVYRLFRRFADHWREKRPDSALSADAVFQRIRWETTTQVTGDTFALNNNARALLVRLYCRERQGAKFELRRSWLDVLHLDEWDAILAAHAKGQGYAPEELP